MEEAEQDLYELEGQFEVTRFTDYHWRFNDKIDVWPTSKKYMVRNGFWKVLSYKDLFEVAERLKLENK